jgi:hypothetical protein
MKGRAYRYELAERRFEEYRNHICANQWADAVVDEVWTNLLADAEALIGARKHKTRVVLQAYLAEAYGAVRSFEFEEKVAWQLAAGRDRLLEGLPLKSNFQMCDEHWAALRITQCSYDGFDKKGSTRVKVGFKIYEGLFAGLDFSQSWPYTYHTSILAPALGFPRYGKTHHMETVGMRLKGYVAVDRWGKPRLLDAEVPSGCQTFNKKLRRIRALPCFWGLPVQKCHQCTYGYKSHAEIPYCEARVRDRKNDPEWMVEVSRATHPYTYKKGLCTKCGQADAWFDPGRVTDACLSCVAKAARRGIRRRR